MQDAIKDVDEPWGARTALKEVEAQCHHVPTSILAQGRSVYILITSSLLAFKLVDTENSTSAENAMSVWAGLTMISFACALELFTWIYKKYIIYMSSKTLPAGSSAPERIGIEMASINNTSATAEAKLPTMKLLKEGVRKVLQTEASDYGVEEHKLEEGVTRNPMRNIADIIPTAR